MNKLNQQLSNVKKLKKKISQNAILNLLFEIKNLYKLTNEDKSEIIKVISYSVKKFFNHKLEKNEVQNKIDKLIKKVIFVFLQVDIIDKLPVQLKVFLDVLHDDFISRIKTYNDYIFSILAQRTQLIKHYYEVFILNLKVTKKNLYKHNIHLLNIQNNITKKRYLNLFQNFSNEYKNKIVSLINDDLDYLYDISILIIINKNYKFSLLK